MTKRMLIDGTHPEETRIAIVDGERLDEFEYESTFRKPLKGSIFLAKVTRVEPSLQAAFVNFGGNRHGFLPFSEIHPDYFRIPISDREALIAEQEEEMKQMEEEEEADADDSDASSEEEGDEPEDEVEELGGEDAVDNVAEDEAEDGDNVGNRKSRAKMTMLMATSKALAARMTTQKKAVTRTADVVVAAEDAIIVDADVVVDAVQWRAVTRRLKISAARIWMTSSVSVSKCAVNIKFKKLSSVDRSCLFKLQRKSVVIKARLLGRTFHFLVVTVF